MTRKRASNRRKFNWAAHALRMRRLSAPITPEHIATFVKHLVAVSFGADSECWLYAGFRRGKVLPEDLAIKTTSYARCKFNGESVGAHQFAWCASNGITIAELDGFDVHHAAKRGRCIGYRCCNPDHLAKVRRRLHRGTQGDKNTLVRFQTKLVKEVLAVTQTLRRPPKSGIGTGTDARSRSLGGVTFLIKGGVMEDVLEASSEELDGPTPA
jgi:hypothetical protein